MSTTELPVQHSEQGDDAAFYLERDGKRLASMTLTRKGERHWSIDHTKVDDSLRGQGAGRKLLDAVVAWAREGSVKITPVCPFAKAQFDKDPSIGDVLAKP